MLSDISGGTPNTWLGRTQARRSLGAQACGTTGSCLALRRAGRRWGITPLWAGTKMAVEQFHGALALDPILVWRTKAFGIAYVLQGRCDRAIDELQLANKLMDGPRRTACLDMGMLSAGRSARPAEF